jgi:hypothetical protein
MNIVDQVLAMAIVRMPWLHAASHDHHLEV